MGPHDIAADACRPDVTAFLDDMVSHRLVSRQA